MLRAVVMMWVRLVILLVLLACLAPAVSLGVAAIIANWNGCSLNEGAVSPCIIGGVDYGQTLYTMFMMGWFLMATLPTATATLALWVLIEVAKWLRTRAVR